MNTNNEMILRLQKNLSVIRKLGGWTTESFGEMIGVTKQTISNLENEKSEMNLTQYIAIRTVLDYEIQKDPEKKAIVAQALSILVDNDSDISEEKKAEYADKFKVVAAATAGAGGAIAAASMATTSATLLGVSAGAALGPIGIAAGAVAGAWLGKIMKNKGKKK